MKQLVKDCVVRMLCLSSKSRNLSFNTLGNIHMFNKLFLALATFIASMGFAFAAVDVNKGDQAALDGIKGIGPATSKAIIDERSKGGNFKDWADFEARVKGVGEKNALKFSEAGLTVNGQAKTGAAASTPKAPVTGAAKAEEKPVTASAASAASAEKTKAEIKAEKKAAKAEAKANKAAEDKAAKSSAAKPAAEMPAATTKAATASKPATTK
jgi:competence protein ComEA